MSSDDYLAFSQDNPAPQQRQGFERQQQSQQRRPWNDHHNNRGQNQHNQFRGRGRGGGCDNGYNNQQPPYNQQQPQERFVSRPPHFNQHNQRGGNRGGGGGGNRGFGGGGRGNNGRGRFRGGGGHAGFGYAGEQQNQQRFGNSGGDGFQQRKRPNRFEDEVFDVKRYVHPSMLENPWRDFDQCPPTIDSDAEQSMPIDAAAELPTPMPIDDTDDDKPTTAMPAEDEAQTMQTDDEPALAAHETPEAVTEVAAAV